MELKSIFRKGKLGIVFRFNRTFMELKLMILFYAIFFFCCFNRTFMELKSEFQVL